MDRYLIIPDSHLQIQSYKKILKSESFDRIIDLGDHWDDFNDTVEQNREMAVFIKDICKNLRDKLIWLISNHDLTYLFPDLTSDYACSGFTFEKQKAILSILKWRDVEKNLRVAYEHNNIIFTHAGCSSYYFEHPILGIRKEGILERCDEALGNLKVGMPNFLFGAGRARGGWEAVGGVTWLDWDREFELIEGINQIVGHSQQCVPEIIIYSYPETRIIKIDGNEFVYEIKNGETFSLNLDTHLKHYAILEGDKLTIKRVK